ncbi:MAG: hypothetical protein ACHQVS_04405 [Candidatus Babeliales bacterium]
MKLVKSLLVITMLLGSTVNVQAKYAVAKGLAGLTAFLALMPIADLVRGDYQRNRALDINAEQTCAIQKCYDVDGAANMPMHMLSADQKKRVQEASKSYDKKRDYLDAKYETFKKRSKIVNNIFQKIHDCFGVNAEGVFGNNILRYWILAGRTALATLGAFGIEYAIRNSAN